MSVSSASAPAGHPSAEPTVLPVILAVALAHLLNDLMQSLIPASYPLLKSELGLTFTQIGLITLVFQGTASLLQPLVGLHADRRPMPYSLAAGMGSTGVGLVLLAHAASFPAVLFSVALIGLGSSIFHPEAARIVRLAAGMRPGFAQSVFQVGGNAGTAFGPLAAGWIVLSRGQTSIAWFAGVALAGVVLLTLVGRWYAAAGAGRALARKARAPSAASPGEARRGMALLLGLLLAKHLYMASFTSYYAFYLIARFDLSQAQALNGLFVFLAAVAAGTVFGGPISDRIGRRRVIMWSIFGILPLAQALPFLPLVPNIVIAALAGMILASAFPAMMIYAQDLMPARTGLVAGLMFGLAFGIGAIGAAALGILADSVGIETVYRLCALLPALGLIAWFLPDPRH